MRSRAVPSSPPPAPARGRCRRGWAHRRPAAASPGDDAPETAASDGAFEALRLYARRVELAAAAEDFAEAARLRDAREALLSRQPARTRLLDELVAVLEGGGSPAAARRLAASRLEEIADVRSQPALFAALAGDPDDGVAALSEAALWATFARCPGREDLEAELQAGVRMMRDVPDGLVGALEAFEGVAERAPGFAEAWNKCATVRYMLACVSQPRASAEAEEAFRAAVRDCHRVLELNPRHFGALSGLGLCHVALRERDEALDAFRRAIAVHPRMESVATYIRQLEAAADDTR